MALARKEGFCSVNPGNRNAHIREKQPDKVILKGSSLEISIYSPATGQIFKGQENAGNLPDPKMPVEPSPDPNRSKGTTHPPVHSNLLGRTIEDEVSTSVGITHDNNVLGQIREIQVPRVAQIQPQTRVRNPTP